MGERSFKQILHKIRQRGLGWLAVRVNQESRQPATPLGRWLRPILYPFSRVISPVAHALARNCRLRKPKSENLFLFYDLDVSPVTYDFCWALAIAELRRISLGLQRIHLVIVPGRYHGLRPESQTYESIVDVPARFWRKNSMLTPLSELLPSCTAVSVCATRDEAAHLFDQHAGYVYPDGYNPTCPIPHTIAHGLVQTPRIMSFQATTQALKYVQQWLSVKAKQRKVIVITLRQYDHECERNSNIPEWLRFIASLDEDQYFPVIVPDSEQAMAQTEDFFVPYDCFLPACWHINLRAALYELAYVNLGVNNGPFALCWFNANCRYLMFKLAPSSHRLQAEFTLRQYGFQLQQSLPFANRYQRWVWRDDTYPNIKTAFEELCAAIESSAISSVSEGTDTVFG